MNKFSKTFCFIGFTLLLEARPHYTGRHCFKFEIRFRGFELFEYSHFRDHDSFGKVYKSYRRVTVLTMLAFGLWLGYNNYLTGKGWEFTVFPMRYGRWFRPFLNWSFGVSKGGYGKYNVVRCGRFAFCNHNWPERAPITQAEEDEYPDYLADTEYDEYYGTESPYEEDEPDYGEHNPNCYRIF